MTTVATLEQLSPTFREAIKKHTNLFQRHIVLALTNSRYEALPSRAPSTTFSSIELYWGNVIGIYVPHHVHASIMYTNGQSWSFSGPHYRILNIPAGSTLKSVSYRYDTLDVVKKTLTQAFIAKNTSIKSGNTLSASYDLACGYVPLKTQMVDMLIRDYCKENPGEDVCSCISPVGGQDLMKSFTDKDKVLLLSRMPCINGKCKTVGYTPIGIDDSSIACPPTVSCTQNLTAVNSDLTNINLTQSCVALTTSSEKFTEPESITDKYPNFWVFVFIILVILLVVFGDPMWKKLKMIINRKKNKA